MKRTLIAALAALICISATAQTSYQPSAENLKARQEFADSKFGIFLHWGLYSIFAQGEWYMSKGELSHQEYKKAADAFYPHRFNAKEWVKAVKDSGAKYICFTARHHDGFSLWDTKYSDYNIVDATPYGKDVLKELSRECHRQGIKLHIYYSHADWTRSDYWPSKSSNKVTGKDHFEGGYENYFKFMNNQLAELLTNYKVNALWFDGMWDRRSVNWRIKEQYEWIHSIQHSCLIGNNHHLPAIEGEDFQIFERDLPGENLAGYSKGQTVSGKLPLETCQTMNGMWGYKVADQEYKSTEYLVRYLLSIACKGANLLLNIGPQPNGELPAEALDRLKDMGEWLRKYGDTVYGTTAGDIQKQDWGVTTRKGNRLFVHIFDLKGKELHLPLSCKVKKAFTFDDKKAVEFTTTNDGVTLKFDTVPSGIDYIVELTTK
ncbi:MAG: alpha-L-fucosidase [Alistipes sp.]|nr:alpha-L-fucosidase [Alistipes sp.]